MIIRRFGPVLQGGSVALLVVSLYWVGLGGTFFFDDEVNILYMEELQVKDLSFQSLLEAWRSGFAGPSGRPVAQLSFALNYFFSGFDPFFFKATNLAIHLVAGLLVYPLSRRLFGDAIVAGAATALWLLHPIQLTSVLYVVQRMTSLSALFLLAALLLHMKGRDRERRPYYLWIFLAWAVCWPLSFLSKETGALFPFLVLAWELLIRRIQRGHVDGFARILAIAVSMATVAGLAYALLPAGQWVWASYEFRGFTPLERLLTEARVLWFYLGLLVMPQLDILGLFHDDIAISTDHISPWTTLPALLGVLFLSWSVWRLRKLAPPVSLGIAWFLIGHSMESTILPLELVHEHRNYFPSLGIALVIAWLLSKALASPSWKKTLGVTLGFAMLFNMTLITGLRAHQYGDEIRRTQIESQHHPQSARTHYEAGRAIATYLDFITSESPHYFFARTHFSLAGELDPNDKLSFIGLAYLNCKVGQTPEPAWIDELALRLQERVFAPGDRSVLHSLKDMSANGASCLSRDDMDKLFNAALTNRTMAASTRAVLHSWRADYLALAFSDLPAAELELEKSLAIASNHPSNRLKQAQLAFLRGNLDRARAILENLQEEKLGRSEKETKMLLNDCLAPVDAAKKCLLH